MADQPVDVVAVGASAGGVGALQELAGHLPKDLRAAVLVVLHLPPAGTSVLADILQRRSDLHVVRAVDGAALRPGTVVVAPPDHHLVIQRSQVRLTREARVNGHRPAIDPLFESAGDWFGRRTLGVLLSGTLDDGVAGLAAIRRAGGITAVQDPDEAAYPGMPVAAIEAGVVDHVLPVEEIAELVGRVTEGGPPALTSRPEATDPVDRATGGGDLGVTDDPHGADPSVRQAALACPSCGGTLWEGDAGGVVQFECRVGHRYSPSSLFAAQGDTLDDALWAAHRALLERADLARRMARRMRRGGAESSALRYDRTSEESESRAAILHRALTLSAPEVPGTEVG